jgi:putative peptide zinc metalloprotease protein
MTRTDEHAAPQLADGIELLGRYEGSGYREPHYLARRADGQVLQLSRVLHALAERADGRHDYAELAADASGELGRTITADNVRVLVERKLRPMGVLAAADGTSPELPKADPLLALRLRAAVVPERLTRALTAVFAHLFHLPVVVALLGALVAVDAWFFLVHGVAQPARELLYNPLLLLLVLGLVVLATAFHEIGHASALRYGGGKPGVMGAGVYIVWPAFYTDVTDAYRLGRTARVRTDLGGVYFNGIFVLLVAGAYAVTGFEPLLVLILVQHMQILQQLLPILRLDGYYVLSDLTGVPDLFSRIKPTLASLVPGREPDPRVRELRTRARAITTAWVVVLVPALLVVFALMVFNAPRALATGWDSLLVQKDRVGTAWRHGRELAVAVAAIQMVMLVLPPLGMTYSFARVVKRLGEAARRWTEGAPVRRAAVIATAAAIAAGAAYVLLPNGDYRRIERAERGTLQGGLLQLPHIAGGRPGLTEERALELDRRRATRVHDAAVPRPAAPDQPRASGRRGAASPPAPAPPPPAAQTPGSTVGTPPGTTGQAPRTTVPTPSTTVKAPSGTVETPSATVETPSATVETPAATVTAPAATVTAPAATVETPTVSVETPQLPPPPAVP